MSQFQGATILLPVISETVSLTQTVDILLTENRPDLHEILLIVCKKTTPASRALCIQFTEQYPHLCKLLEQQLPFLGGAMRDAFDAASGSHTLMMASDLETDPLTVKDLISWSKKYPDCIITTSRWLREGGFEGYSLPKLVFNFIFQKMFSFLYGVKLTDMTYGFRIFPTQLIQSIRWEELRHAFLFETVIKPLRLGVRVYEIPAAWKVRSEGESQNTFWQNFIYFRTGWKTLFRSKESIVK